MNENELINFMSYKNKTSHLSSINAFQELLDAHIRAFILSDKRKVLIAEV